MRHRILVVHPEVDDDANRAAHGVSERGEGKQYGLA
jgi:hypothetical protein